MLESALSYLLEGRHAFGARAKSSLGTSSDADAGHRKVIGKFSHQLQTMLKTMLANANNTIKHSSRSGSVQSRSKMRVESGSRMEVQSTSSRVGDVGKLRELYRISLKSDGMPDLYSMYEMWTS
eukprot:Gb_32190 [translate_table: standard]